MFDRVLNTPMMMNTALLEIKTKFKDMKKLAP